MNRPFPTPQMWETVLASLHWSEAAAVETPSPAYRAWMRGNSHTHAYSEIIVSLAGSHLYGIGGKAVRVSPGSAALISSQVPHDAWYSVHHQECIDFWLHCLPHGAVALNFVFHEPATGPDLVPVPHPSTALEDDFRKACLLLNAPGVLGRRKARHLMAYLLHELFERLVETDPASQSMDEQSVIEEVKRYAVEHLTDRLTLTDLAKAAGYSPFHFHRMFLEREGVTPRAFVEARRLKHSCNLLRKGHSITSTAMDSGFATPSQFTRVFKKQFQVSPSEWVKTAP